MCDAKFKNEIKAFEIKLQSPVTKANFLRHTAS